MVIVVNFKTYSEGTGYKAIELARLCRKVQEETGVRIVVVPQIADLRDCVETGVDCWVQHVDPVQPGKNTGWITCEDVEQAGAKGTLLNHSEHRLEWEVLKNTMELISGKAFEGCLCVKDIEEAVKAAELKPDFVAYELPELIGNTEKSVASEKPEIIKNITQMIKIPVLIGAGVHSAEDVKMGLSLGAKGILLATDIVLAVDPEKELRELAGMFKSGRVEE
jgi:triosephosphate isomerase